MVTFDREEAKRLVSEELAKYSYKPGSEFGFWSVTDWYVSFYLIVTAPGVDGKHVVPIRQDITMGHSYEELKPERIEGFVRTAVKQMVWQIEEHESQEWLLYEDDFVTNPHPDIGGYMGRKRYLDTPFALPAWRVP